MNVLLSGLSGSPSFKKLQAAVKAGNTPVYVSGVGQIHKVLLTAALSESARKRVLLLTADEAEATRLCEDLCALGKRALVYPAREISLRDVTYGSREFEQQRLGVLASLAQDTCDVVCTTAEAAAQFTLPPETLATHTLTIKDNAPLPVADLAKTLVEAGYERCDQIEGAGQFAVRGGIIDIFPAAGSEPARLELWGDTVDSLSSFDRLTQRRTEPLKTLVVPPAVERVTDDRTAVADRVAALAESLSPRQAECKARLLADADKIADGLPFNGDKYVSLLYETPATLFDYVPEALCVLSEPHAVRERAEALGFQWRQDVTDLLKEQLLCKELCAAALDYDEVVRRLSAQGVVLMDTFARTERDFELKETVAVNARQLPIWSGDLTVLKEDLEDLRARKMKVAVLAGAEEKNASLLAEDLTARGVPALYAKNPAELTERHVTVLCGGLSAGAEFPDAGFAVLTHGRVASKRQKARYKAKNKGSELHSLSELRPGDYVVHTVHGIGQYCGVQQLDVQGVTKDYLKLKYAKGDVLYVPVTQLDLVSKYIGASEDATVKLHRLGGQEWQSTKSRVRSAVKDIAKELIALYSKRMATPGFAFDPDEEWQYDFERRFEYEETDDQLRCTDEIKHDMERAVPMDRLLCGDVGFGKTEVALRAAFKCVSQGKQCAILVPTTILAFQHYQTLLKRFEGFPVRIDMLSRFRTAKQQEKTVAALKRGEVEIVVGTHRLLSKDVEFRDLGLFIVDEEQRFGVTQKERLKEMTPNVDVLTLSATPIPRTLNMALSGIRDMSIIEEAPQDRRPVQTYVLEHDNGVLLEAIRRELRRGGQVYYLHNRVEDIERVAVNLKANLPDANIAVAHGKMSEEELSDIWRRVMEQDIDVLVCTTIIETGVDIANVNTLIIEHADRFGLSQLHQLRGRVGRSSRRAFAYLTFSRGKVLTDISAKRLEAMREFTEFGAGFKIAMRDMELRGAGNLLGAQQHGHMESVGYDLYLKMLGDAVAEQKGEAQKPREEECLIDLPVSAHIPDGYIADHAARLDVYRHIADIRTVEDSLDVYDELIDRFGEPPTAVQGLIDVALLRNMAAGLGIFEVKQQADALLLKPRTLDMELGARMSSALKGRVMISAGSTPYYAVKMKKGLSSLDTLREALEAATEQAGETE